MGLGETMTHLLIRRVQIGDVVINVDISFELFHKLFGTFHKLFRTFHKLFGTFHKLFGTSQAVQKKATANVKVW